MNIIRVGNDLVVEETGEYAGPADLNLPEVLETEEHLQAFMHRVFEAESRLQQRRRELNAIIENCALLVRDQEKRVDWLRLRYFKQAADIAKELLPRKANGELVSKTYKNVWGKIAYRSTKERITVKDEALALLYCRNFDPNAIKVSESVQVSKLSPQSQKSILESGDIAAVAGFTVVPASEVVSMTTIEDKDEEN